MVKPMPSVLPENLRLLVIDDEEEVREGTQLVLESRGCIVTTVAGTETEQLLSTIKQFEPDVIVSDYRLYDGENGLDAIRAVRQVTGRDVPALLITGDTAIDFAPCGEMVRIEVLYKPVDISQLFEKIAFLAERSAGDIEH